MNRQKMHEAMFVTYHIRGRQKASSLRRCESLADIIRQGEELFASFHERNPWISVDSERKQVIVGVDPDRLNRLEEKATA